MADVRALLRQERAARQQNNAKPSRPKSQVPTAAPAGKKRKANDDDYDNRKRARAEEEAGLPTGFFDGGAPEEDLVSEPTLESEEPLEKQNQLQSPPQPTPHIPATIDEDEWAAFERDVADDVPLQKSNGTLNALTAISTAPTISANAMTAEELAAQAREEQSLQRGLRDAELEAEKEDAARHLEEEFDEMEELEQRVRKLREKREALRVGTMDRTPPITPVIPSPEINRTNLNPEDESDEDDDDDDFDDWRYRTV